MHELPPPPHPGAAWPARDATYVDMSRSGMGVIIVGIVLVGVLGGLATAGAIWPQDMLTSGGEGGERTVAAVLAQAGLWYVEARQAHLIPWRDITAVGGSYRVESRAPKATPGAAIGQELVRRAFTDDGRKFFAVEVFVRGSDVPAWVVAKAEPPRPGLPQERLRLVIGGIRDYRRMAAHLHQRVPHQWLGEYQRP